MELFGLVAVVGTAIALFIIGIGLGWWIRQQLATAEVTAILSSQKPSDRINVMTPAQQDAARKSLEAEINAKMRASGLPFDVLDEN